MKSSTTPSFRKRLSSVPPAIRRLAIKNYRLWMRDPFHPSIHFKKVGRFWSARIGSEFRALAIMHGSEAQWFWIGPHDEYDQLIKS
jgi:hypothetical protein